MDIFEATASYESWIGEQVPLDQRDLDKKHDKMAKDAFAFLRGSFHRWSMLWPAECAELADAPRLLGVGDLHIENFGTWRDAETRLVWGLNDADEATDMPYTFDLVRLATSAILADRQKDLAIGENEACAAILGGYRKALKAGAARPFVLEEGNLALRDMARSKKREPSAFWDKIAKRPTIRAPGAVRALLVKHLPHPTPPFRVVRRKSGLGSLGRPRYAAVATVDGALMAREAKMLASSAYDWALGRKANPPQAEALLCAEPRCADPTITYEGRWQVRRIAPRCARIDLDQLPKDRDESRLLKAMGHETANLHRLHGRTAAILKHLRGLDEDWLPAAARRMADTAHDEWKLWRRHWQEMFPPGER